MASLHHRIHHVIYIVKENRTYDQVLGDLKERRRRPEARQFPQAMTPNQHALAQRFVDLDNFLLLAARVSHTGWNWTHGGAHQDDRATRPRRSTTPAAALSVRPEKATTGTSTWRYATYGRAPTPPTR